jgi:hypothetical protein
VLQAHVVHKVKVLRMWLAAVWQWRVCRPASLDDGRLTVSQKTVMLERHAETCMFLCMRSKTSPWSW